VTLECLRRSTNAKHDGLAHEHECLERLRGALLLPHGTPA
jgi:hypothetical protein